MSTVSRDLCLGQNWVELFSDNWPSYDELNALLAEDVTYIERPSLVNPHGSVSDRTGLLVGLETDSSLFSKQTRNIIETVKTEAITVVKYEQKQVLALHTGEWKAGTQLLSWCTDFITECEGRIQRIERFVCYQAIAPKDLLA